MKAEIRAWQALGVLMMAAGAVGIASGCSAFNKPGCTQQDLKDLTTQEYNELTDVCAGKTPSTCAEWKVITEKYDAKRREWATCHPKQ